MSNPFFGGGDEAMPFLCCTLCPKQPQFSDISHLLTHISSKGHLSHKFKLSIRASSEPQARAELATFDIWYAENGLDEKLAERLASKEQKTTSKRVRNAAKAPPKPKPKVTRERLSQYGDSVKQEYDAEDGPATPNYHGQAPRMHMWNTRPMVVGSPSFESEQSSRWEEKDGYATPTMRRSLPNFTRKESSERDSNPHPSIYTSPSTKNGLADDSVSDNSKLKGIYWPGMDLFDSATTQMKRMRNQKKDGTILAQMKKTSRVVTPNEFTYNTQGELQRIKDIYETSPECSPSKSEKAPSPKKRRPGRKSKAALGEMSVNVPGNATRNTRYKGQVLRSQPARTAADIQRLNQFKQPIRTTVNPLSGYGNQKFMRHTEEDDELALTLNNMGKKPMAVFRDKEEEPSPGRTESPLEERRYGIQQNFTYPPPPDANWMGNRFDFHHPLEAPASSRIRHDTPPPMQRPGLLQFGDKENAQPDYITRRATGSDNAFPPHAFHNQSFNPLSYQQSYQPYGYGNGFGESPAFQGEYKPPQSPYQSEYKIPNPSYQPEYKQQDFRPIGASEPYNGYAEFKPPQPNFSGDYKQAQPGFSGDFKHAVMPSPFRDSNERNQQLHHSNEHSSYNANPFTFNM